MIRSCFLCGVPTELSIAGEGNYTPKGGREVRGLFTLPLCAPCIERVMAEDVCAEAAADMYKEVVRQVCEPVGRCM